MERNFDLKNRFEIKEEYGLEAVPGLVVVLDGHLPDEQSLVGLYVEVNTPEGKKLNLKIDLVKDHKTVTSLYFKSLTMDDIPEESTIKLNLPPED